MYYSFSDTPIVDRQHLPPVIGPIRTMCPLGLILPGDWEVASLDPKCIWKWFAQSKPPWKPSLPTLPVQLPSSWSIWIRVWISWVWTSALLFFITALVNHSPLFWNSFSPATQFPWHPSHSLVNAQLFLIPSLPMTLDWLINWLVDWLMLEFKFNKGEILGLSYSQINFQRQKPGWFVVCFQ